VSKERREGGMKAAIDMKEDLGWYNRWLWCLTLRDPRARSREIGHCP
jgi:hypothetical protein